MAEDAKKRKGLIIVYTGQGKGKTTAALGTALRACGHGWKVLMIQFIKGTGRYGELEAAKRLAPNFEIIRAGKGFYRIMGDRLPEEVHPRAAEAGLALSRDRISSGQYDLIILDEINVAVHEGLIPVEEVLALLDAKPEALHLILTGRNAHPQIIERADLVTEMREVKHPYAQGIPAQQGIEY
ncbi:MAG: cob(I)yrinic acid a,c-diamide adenosyltransferase [Anaerolineae bacterium]